MKSLIVFASLAVLSLPAVEIPLGGIGYRYDGSGVYAGCKPPTDADPATGKGVRWKIPTANWGWSQPVEIGDQVLVLCEPGAEDVVWPTLVSYDRKTGKEQWRTAIDPLLSHQLSATEREKLTEQWALVNEHYRFMYSTAADYPAADAKGRAAINAKLGERNCQLGKYKAGYGLLRSLKNEYKPYRDALTALKPYGPKITTWQNFGKARIGATFATPVTDGERILVQTLYGTVAGLDMSGKILWIKDTGARQLGNKGQAASPRIVHGTGLSCQNGLTVAWDMKTGKELWRNGNIKGSAGHGYIGSGAVMDVGGVIVFVDQTHMVLRVSDGKPMSAILGPPKYSSVVYDDEADQFFVCFGKGEKSITWIGYQLKADGDAVTVEEMWKLSPGLGGITGVFYQGEIFQGGKVFSPKDGWMIRGFHWSDMKKSREERGPFGKGKGGGASPATKNYTLAADGKLFGLGSHYIKDKEERKSYKGPAISVLQIFSTKSKKLATIKFPLPTNEDPHGRKVWEQGIIDERGPNIINVVDYGYSFSFGRDCIYVRNPGYIYCLGN